MNERGDVRLVQYLLRSHYGARAGGLAVDGWGGPATNAWISTFQKDMAAQGNKILADGRFDRAFGDTSSVSRTVYGICLLNLYVARRNPGAYAALPRAVAMNPNPRANPYNAGFSATIRERDIVLVRRTNEVFEFVYKDGTRMQIVLAGNEDLAVDQKVLRPGDHYVRMPDGSFRKIADLLDWRKLAPIPPGTEHHP